MRPTDANIEDEVRLVVEEGTKIGDGPVAVADLFADGFTKQDRSLTDEGGT